MSPVRQFWLEVFAGLGMIWLVETVLFPRQKARDVMYVELVLSGDDDLGVDSENDQGVDA